MSIVRMTPDQYQKKVLKRLLKKAQYTMFGRTYRFSKILASPQFVNKFRINVYLKIL